MLFASITVLALIIFAPNMDIYGNSGIFVKLTPFLAVISPFFLAALAAVATFGGTKFFDEDFKMAEPVTLSVIGEMGALESINVKPRHFLSLLFGYCCVVALNLFIFSIFVPQIAGGLADLLGNSALYISWLGLLVFLFFFYQVIIATLLGIYFLSDKMHRE